MLKLEKNGKNVPRQCTACTHFLYLSVFSNDVIHELSLLKSLWEPSEGTFTPAPPTGGEFVQVK